MSDLDDWDERPKDPHLIREVACLLYAADVMWFKEQPTAEVQLKWCRGVLLSGERQEKHSGDCTKQAHTCVKCIWEEWSEKAKIVLTGADLDWIQGFKYEKKT